MKTWLTLTAFLALSAGVIVGFVWGHSYGMERGYNLGIDAALNEIRQVGE